MFNRLKVLFEIEKTSFSTWSTGAFQSLKSPVYSPQGVTEKIIPQVCLSAAIFNVFVNRE
jgi:hypothetical protein